LTDGQAQPIHDVLAEVVRYGELAVELLDRLTEDGVNTLADPRVRKVLEDEPLIAQARELTEKLNEWLAEAQETLMGRAFAEFLDFQRREEPEDG
jgi:predicted phage gp36 major capsid-like protein